MYAQERHPLLKYCVTTPETCILQITKCTPDASLVDEDCDGNVDENDDDNNDDSRNATTLTSNIYSNSLDSVKKAKHKVWGLFFRPILRIGLERQGTDQNIGQYGYKGLLQF